MRDAGSVGRCLVGDAAERFDKGCDVVHRGSELGPDLDERGPELLRRLEQQLPGSAPGEVVLTPPARGEFDLDVLQAGGLDLGPEGGEADGLADDLQVTLGEADPGPAGRCDGAYAVDRGERADLRVVERRDVAGAGPAGRDECWGAHAFRSTSTETPSAAERTAASARIEGGAAVFEAGAGAGPAMDGLDEGGEFEAVGLGVALEEERVVRGDSFDGFGAVGAHDGRSDVADLEEAGAAERLDPLVVAVRAVPRVDDGDQLAAALREA